MPYFFSSIFLFFVVQFIALHTNLQHNVILLIAQKLKELRIKKGFSSYEQFANQFDIDRKQYWRIENGSNITINTLNKILTIHNQNLQQFFNQIDFTP